MADREQQALFDRLEDAQADQAAADESRCLDDDQLERGGMRPIRAWVRTHASSNALRQRRKRERDQATGIVQCNVPARQEHHEVLRGLAAASRDGDLIEALRAILADLDPGSLPESDLAPADRRVLVAARSPGLRGRLIRLLTRA